MSLYTHCCALCEEKENDYFYAQASKDFWLCEKCRDKLRVLIGEKQRYGCEEYQKDMREEVRMNLGKIIMEQCVEKEGRR